ncbi:MAG: hypothetical protein SGCHY_005211 [Lobulomycetales sp.]
MTKAEKDSAPPSLFMVCFAIGFYMVSSIAMVMTSKAVLNRIEVPISFLALQCLVAVVLISTASLFGIVKLPKVDWDTCRKLVPLVSVNVIGLTFNTLCLKHVDASFFQVARSLVLPMTLILSRVILNQKSSIGLLISCGIVCTGYFVGVDPSLTNSSAIFDWGLFFGVLSSATTAVHAIVIKTALKTEGLGTMDLVFLNNLLSFFLCLPVVLIGGEFGTLFAMATQPVTDGYGIGNFLLGSVLVGAVGLLINIASFIQIKVTSPVSHMVSSAVRGVLQTFVAILLFGDVVTAKRWIGIVLILAGSSLYSLIKSYQVKRAKLQQAKEVQYDVESLLKKNDTPPTVIADE